MLKPMIDGSVSEGSVASVSVSVCDSVCSELFVLQAARLKSMEPASIALTILFFITSLPVGFFTFDDYIITKCQILSDKYI